MTRAVLLITLATAMLAMNGCTTVYVNGSGATKPVALTASAEEPFNTVGHFHCAKRAWYVLWGLLPISQPDVGQVASSASGTGNAVVNLSVMTQYDLLDVLIDVVLGFATITTRSVAIEGDIARYQEKR